jgi:hypothetical protein
MHVFELNKFTEQNNIEIETIPEKIKNMRI